MFKVRDAGPLPELEAGQYLPMEIEVAGIEESVRRTYLLPGAPRHYQCRITVKREPQGLVSRHLHDHTEPGAIIDTCRPTGGFMMSCNTCSVALVSAGVCVTPMVSMLQALAAPGDESPVWLVHGARGGGHHPPAHEILELTVSRAGAQVHIAYSRPCPENEAGIEYDSKGRVDGAHLASLIEDVEAHYFSCGPTRFMGDIQTVLERRNIPSEYIHMETFGSVG